MLQLSKKAILILLACLSLTGCIQVYKKDIIQGNYLTQEMCTKLKKGMTKEQVQEIMGTPALVSVIDLTRWDYFYSFKPGKSPQTEKKLLSLHFSNNTLASYSGDLKLNLPKKL